MLEGDELDQYIANLVHGHEEQMVSEMIEYLAYEMVRQTNRGEKLDDFDLVTLQHASLNAKKQLKELHLKYRSRISTEIESQVLEALQRSDDNQVSILSKIHPTVTALPYSTHFKEMSHHTIRGIREIVERQNLQMEENLERAWYKATTEAVTAYNHGLRTKEDSLTRGVLKLMRDGLTTIDYASGIKSNLDVALRRHMKAQLSQTLTLMNEMRDDEYGHDLVYVTSVPSPRPSHADWELQVFSRSGTDKKYPERSGEMLDPITGIGGVNCRHTYVPYYGDFQLQEKYKPPYSEELRRDLTEDEWYDATQKQRYYERQIRDAKRKQFAAEMSGNGQEAATQKLRLGKFQQKQKKLVKGNGLARLYEREHAYGLPYQPRGSAVWAMQEGSRSKLKPTPFRIISIDNTRAITPNQSHEFKVIDDLGKRSNSYLAFNGAITEKKVFAGKGTNQKYRKAAKLKQLYGGSADNWCHSTGIGVIYEPSSGKLRYAEFHWAECSNYVYELRWKRWLQ